MFFAYLAHDVTRVVKFLPPPPPLKPRKSRIFFESNMFYAYLAHDVTRVVKFLPPPPPKKHGSNQII